MLAELAVGDPRPARLRRLERQVVDVDRSRTEELDVVRARVAEGQPDLERGLLDLEREECGVPELAERPLVRVGDERDRRGPDDAGRGRGGREFSSGAWSYGRTLPASASRASSPVASTAAQRSANDGSIWR
jgi:hypothetical protein